MNDSVKKRLSDLKAKFEHFISAEKLDEVRAHFTETLEHASETLSEKVDHEVKLSLKQTSDFIESQKNELETFQKRINALLKKFTPAKKKKSKAAPKKASAKKAAPAKSKKTAKKRA